MNSHAVTLAALLLLSLPLSPTLATAIALPRDVIEAGPEGDISLLDRWRDTVGTATQVWARGAASKKDIFQTDRSGPLSNVYRSTLGTAASTACEPDAKGKCEVAIDGFGTVGEVHFLFESSLGNIKGRSTQVMIACRCVSKECGEAILMRPIDIPTRDKDGNPVETADKKKTCIYEQANGNFTDCHTELLRVTYRDRAHRPNFLHSQGDFNYSVTDPNYGDFWNATGQRGWQRDCDDEDVKSLSVFDSSTLKRENIGFNVHSTNPTAPHCKPSSDKVEYFRENDESGAQCAELYEYAAAAASHRATQQDETSIGNVEGSYVYPKPELVSNTELALSCSGAALGLLFVWSVFRKQLFKRNATTFYTAWVTTIQVLSFVLEALPLHTALGTEISARNWVSQFASVDGTVALAKGHSTPQGSAQGSVLILTAVLGEVRYRETRVGLIAILTVFFDVTVVILVILTMLRKLRVRKLQKRGLVPKRTIKDPEFSDKLPMIQLVPEMRIPGTRRRTRNKMSADITFDMTDLEPSEIMTTPGTSAPSVRAKADTWEETDDSLKKTVSDIVSMDGLTDFLMGTVRDEDKEGEETYVERVCEGNTTDETRDEANDGISSGDEEQRSEPQVAETHSAEDEITAIREGSKDLGR